MIVPGSWVLDSGDLSSGPSFAPCYACLYLYRMQSSHLKMETIILHLSKIILRMKQVYL